MREALLELICCPACRQQLAVTVSARREPEIWEGQLECTVCHTTYPVEKGMPQLFVNDASWQSKAIEADGWVTYHKNLGIYEVHENAPDLRIPYFPEEPWIGVAKSFDVSLAELRLSGSETILDLGAGRGWAAKHFAQKGCRVVALDVVPDENVGLGRGRALMDDAGTYFDRIIGDGENLPFFDGKFDLIFCAAALHHASDLPKLMENVGRVLRQGGRLCAINEPCRSVTDNEANMLARDAGPELDVGINETRPDLPGYQRALSQAGLRTLAVYPPLAQAMDDDSLRTWAGAMGAIRPSFRPIPIRQQIAAWLKFIVRRGRTLGQGHSLPLEETATERQRLETAVLYWVGGEMFLLAEKVA